MKFVADLHVHSHYSRATSRDCNPENLQQWAMYKGITLLGTGDFTHPAWREELRTKLEPAEEGFYRLRGEFCRPDEFQPPGSSAVRFVVTGEISTIYKKGGRVRKVHHLLVLPSLEDADELSRRLEIVGNIRSDGRPILGLDSRNLLEMILEACPEALYIPAHIWTPHFSVFGANSGFDSLEECYGDLKDYIYAVETGLSSDPPMNWRLSALDNLALVSNSDAHSPRNLAREANLFNTDLSYSAIRRALIERNPEKFLGTLEFFPEEGKYHWDGHRECQVRWEPVQTRAAAGVCPTCGRKVTVGVLHRVEELADRPEGFRPEAARPFESLVPLPEIIASALGVGVQSKKVGQQYRALLSRLGPELTILRETSLELVAQAGGDLVAESIRRMRAGEVEALPGFDGEYGKIQLLQPEERKRLLKQTALFEEAESDTTGAMLGDMGGTIPDNLSTEISKAAAPITDLSITKNNTADYASPSLLASSGISNYTGLLGDLNLEQQAVITMEKGPVVVIAGPGTGKTHTLVRRIAYLIQQQGVQPHQITAVTFTNKAALEIRKRLTELLAEPIGIEEITVGTFHSICLDLLRAYQGEDQQLIVFDETDSQSVFEEVIREREGKKPRNLIKLYRELSFLKSRGIKPSSPEVSSELAPFYQAYQERLAEYQALDYDDLLLKAVEIFETAQVENPRVGQTKFELFKQKIEQRFNYLLVDEFQDVNSVQYRLVQAWAGTGENAFIIGDPDQAIYGFRGADYRFFGQFKEDYPEAKVFQLRLNYRSTPFILHAAAAVIAQNQKSQPVSTDKAELMAVRKNGPKIQHWVVASEVAEGIAVCQEINRLVGGTTMLQSHGQGAGLAGKSPEVGDEEERGFSEIVVLFRTGRQGAVLEECMLKEGIPYRIMGKESFLENPEVRETLAFLWCLVNPEDDFHLYRCLGSSSFSFNRKQVSLIRETSRRQGCSAWKAITEIIAGQSNQQIAVVQKLQAFCKIIESYRSRLLSNSPEQLLTDWIEENHNVGRIKERESINRLLRISSRYLSLSVFLNRLVLAAEADHERPGNPGWSPEMVTLMTLHAAKGLEFPVVFIAGFEDGLIPLKSRKTGHLTEDDLAEERRLCYVGLTRAKDQLVLLTVQNRTAPGSKAAFQPQPSGFLEEIPNDLLEKRVWNKQGGKKKEDDDKGNFQQLRLF